MLPRAGQVMASHGKSSNIIATYCNNSSALFQRCFKSFSNRIMAHLVSSASGIAVRCIRRKSCLRLMFNSTARNRVSSRELKMFWLYFGFTGFVSCFHIAGLFERIMCDLDISDCVRTLFLMHAIRNII